MRFARVLDNRALVDQVEHGTTDFPTFVDALRSYLAETGEPDLCGSAAIAAAGPVGGDQVELTNTAWTIRRDEVMSVLNGAPVALVNDLQAAAMSIPHLRSGDITTISVGTPPSEPAATRLAVNVGTGFGAATLVQVDGRCASFPSEAGHMTFAAASAKELALATSGDHPIRSVEDVLSGPGLKNLYDHFAGVARREPSVALGARMIVDRVTDDPAARQAVDMFTSLLARICGDLVLASAAWDGLYLFGGVVLGWHEHADFDLFRETIQAKGKMASRMNAVPIHVVKNRLASLIGLAHM